MPEISRFYGIVIAIYYNDHAPPHFHAKYAGEDASIEITTGNVTDGSIAKRALKLVEEWREAHVDELLEDWNLARARQPLHKIEPLD